MAQSENITDRIRARRAEIRRILAEMEAREAVLAEEERDLCAAERALARLLPDRPPAMVGGIVSAIVAANDPISSDEVSASGSQKLDRKPDGLPTIVEMASQVLSDAAARNDAWLDARQITQEIRRRWWPSVETSFITPQLWRAATKRKILLKDGARYALPRTNEKSLTVGAARLSQTNGAEAS